MDAVHPLTRELIGDRMFPLTLDGLDRAMRELKRKSPILGRMSARATASLIALTLAAASLAQAPSEGAIEPATALVTVPALTPVIVRIEDEISSNANKSGDRFRITVAEDVRVGDALVIPAGSVGEGEVVHAAKSGAGGKAGELILVARFVRVGDNDIRLRSFALGVVGKDQSDNSLAASMVIGPFAMIQKGGDAYTVRPKPSAPPRRHSNSSFRWWCRQHRAGTVSKRRNDEGRRP